jgi:hypothetical protein
LTPIYQRLFFRSETFQWVASDSNKKPPCFLNSRAGCG